MVLALPVAKVENVKGVGQVMVRVEEAGASGNWARL